MAKDLSVPEVSLGSTSIPAVVLLLDTEETNSKMAPMLRQTYRVTAASEVGVAREFLRRSRVDVFVSDLQLHDGATIPLCREAKALATPPAVLVTSENVDRVPDALEARCDAVLLKPFPPNLLFARIGRLIRARMQHTDRRDPTAPSGSNRVWPDTACPYCKAPGITSFEHASHRRSWYACGACKKVWLGKRRE